MATVGSETSRVLGLWLCLAVFVARVLGQLPVQVLLVAWMALLIVSELAQMFFVAPHFQSHGSFRSVEVLYDRSRAMPSALLIEPRRAVIANRACEPRSLHAPYGKSCLGVGNQRRSNATEPKC